MNTELAKHVNNARIQIINMHIHTRYSDGAFNPNDIIDRSIQHKLDIISFTDHDTIEAYNHIKKSNGSLKILPGIELSSTWKGNDVHILGYGIDIKNHDLLNILSWMKDGRRKRADSILNKLSHLGAKISLDSVLSFAGDVKLIVRPHIAQALVAAKHCKTKQEAFEKYIGNEAPAYEPKPELSSADVIELIHQAAGIAVIAHPNKLKSQDFIPELIREKLDGIEVWHPDHNTQKVSEYQAYCISNGLIMTGGTDFHGEFDVDNYIGSAPVSEQVLTHVQKLWDDYSCRKI